MPTTIEALVIIALVISPGYIFAKFAGGVIAFANASGDLRLLLPTVTFGTGIHLLLSPWSIRIVDFYRDDQLEHHAGELAGWGAVTVFIAPALAGIIVGSLSNVDVINKGLERIGLGYVDRMPSAWDYVLRLEQPAFMKVYLKDGKTIGGLFSTSSFASTTPERSDIYLQQVWLLDENNNFTDQPLTDNWGIWIAHDTISHIELFTSGPEETEEEPNDEPDQNGGLPAEAKPAVRQRQARRAAKAGTQADSAAADHSTKDQKIVPTGS